MAQLPHRRQPGGFRSASAAALALATLSDLGFGGTAMAQQAGYGQTLGTSPMERQIYGTGSSGGSGTPLDARNPIDLMNQLRRSTALDDATPPSSAVDQALKDLEKTSAPAPSRPPAGLATPGASLKGP